MITKSLSNNQEGQYDLKITDKNGRSFTMTIGGNFDLYWMPEDYKECKTFEISNDDEFTFYVFSRLFAGVKENDDKYCSVVTNDTITFVSEDWNEGEANVLTIKKQESSFIIDFVKNENKNAWSFPHIGCDVCFCNSGSRVPDVEQVFMQMFNYLAYKSKSVKCESSENEREGF